MPYIDPEKRADIHRYGVVPERDPGQLNYLITNTIVGYLPDYPTYADFNEVIGVLECAKQELYRRMVAPYEDEKQRQNGDVYPDV